MSHLLFTASWFCVSVNRAFQTRNFLINHMVVVETSMIVHGRREASFIKRFCYLTGLATAQLYSVHLVLLFWLSNHPLAPPFCTKLVCFNCHFHSRFDLLHIYRSVQHFHWYSTCIFIMFSILDRAFMLLSVMHLISARMEVHTGGLAADSDFSHDSLLQWMLSTAILCASVISRAHLPALFGRVIEACLSAPSKKDMEARCSRLFIMMRRPRNSLKEQKRDILMDGERRSWGWWIFHVMNGRKE